MQRIMWINQTNKDPIHRKMVYTKKGFVETMTLIQKKL